jgi:hypothetical protein
MKKLAHVPVQAWRGWTPDDLFGRWFSALGSFKPLIGMIGLLLGGCLILRCLVLLVLWSVRTIMEATLKSKTPCI